jgi:dynein intermediate chain 1
MRNKFNYNAREAQTANLVTRERGVSTEPPPSDTIRGEVTQWEIFDAYMADYAKVEQPIYINSRNRRKNRRNRNKHTTTRSTSPPSNDA